MYCLYIKQMEGKKKVLFNLLAHVTLKIERSIYLSPKERKLSINNKYCFWWLSTIPTASDDFGTFSLWKSHSFPVRGFGALFMVSWNQITIFCSMTGCELLLTLKTYLNLDHLSSLFPRAADQTSPGRPALHSLRVSGGFHRMYIGSRGQNLQQTRLDSEFGSQNQIAWLTLFELMDVDVSLPFKWSLSPATSSWQIVRHLKRAKLKFTSK